MTHKNSLFGQIIEQLNLSTKSIMEKKVIVTFILIISFFSICVHAKDYRDVLFDDENV